MSSYRGRLISICKDIIALLSGAMMVLAFAPHKYFFIAILGLIFLLWTWLRANPLRAAWRGFLFGLGFFGVGASWIYISIHVYGNSPLWAACLITGALIVAMSLTSIALPAYIWRRFFSYHNANSLLLAFPTLWVLGEWLRSWVLTGFPWLYLGYSQSNSLLRDYAPFGGVYLVSFAVALSAGLILYTVIKRQNAMYSIACLVLVWCVAGALGNIKWTQKQSTPLHVALMQGNVPQSLKWDPQQAADTLALYKSLTEKYWDYQIIVWPEGAIPMLPEQSQEYLAYLHEQSKKNNVALITGIPVYQNGQYYNAMIGVGAALGHYYKRHLVPFGEYVPLETLLRGLINFFNLPMSNFSAGEKYQSGINLFGFDIASAICYEVAYPEEFLTQFPDSKLIVTVSNDAWFGDSFAPAQQLQISQMRSLETGRYQLIATDNGITAIIDPKGRILDKLPQFQTGVLTGTVYAMYGSTPLVALGMAPILFIFFVFLFLAFAYRPETIKRKKSV